MKKESQVGLSRAEFQDLMAGNRQWREVLERQDHAGITPDAADLSRQRVPDGQAAPVGWLLMAMALMVGGLWFYYVLIQ
jgi:hypothetical protein